jgi:hypothetical protein
MAEEPWLAGFVIWHSSFLALSQMATRCVAISAFHDKHRRTDSITPPPPRKRDVCFSELCHSLLEQHNDILKQIALFMPTEKLNVSTTLYENH